MGDYWTRIRNHAGEEFKTVQGLAFTYGVSGNQLRVFRDGREINRLLARSNFDKALDQFPASGPGVLRGVQGQSYVWAIVTDKRIRAGG